MKSLAIYTAAGLLGLASPAMSAVVVNTNTDTATLSGSGGSWTVNYDSLVEGSNIPAIDSNIVFTLGSIAANGLSATLTYQINNTSTTPARLSVFGFRVLGATLRASNPVSTSTAPFGVVLTGNDTLPQLNNFPINICFKVQGQGNNCNNGAQNSGVTAGNSSALGTITLRFQSAVTQFSIDHFAVRYQSLNNGGSGVGTGQINAIPEPATWAMMIGGFGLVGGAMRRRRRTTVSFA